MTNPAKRYAGVPGFNLDTDDAPTPATKLDEKTVILRGVQVPLNSDVGGAFVADCARNRERIFSDDRIREKYEIDDNTWTAITQNKALRLLVNAECERRTFNNDAAREAAAKFFTQAPSVMNGILQDPAARSGNGSRPPKSSGPLRAPETNAPAIPPTESRFR
jgi:hypothetical protein